MRLRQLKAHLVQIVLAGVLLYLIICLVDGDNGREPSLAIKYEQYRRIAAESSRNEEMPESAKVDGLALSIVEKMHENERARMNVKHGMPPAMPRLPQAILDTILAQVPGGQDAVARKDYAAIETMEALVKRFKDNFAKSNLKPQDLARQFAAHMYDGQKMLGPMPDIRKEPPFFSPKRLGQKLDLGFSGPTYLNKELDKMQGLNVEAKDAIMQHIQQSNPRAFEFMQAFKNLQAHKSPPGSEDLDTNALIQKLANAQKNDEEMFANAQPPVGVQQQQLARDLVNMDPALLKQAEEWLNQQKFSVQSVGDTSSEFEQQFPQGVAQLSAHNLQSDTDNNIHAVAEKTPIDVFGGSKNPDPYVSHDTFPKINSPNFSPEVAHGTAELSLPNQQALPLNPSGGINIHQLWKVKNMIDNGMSEEEIKKAMGFGAPQLVAQDQGKEDNAQPQPAAEITVDENVSKSKQNTVLQQISDENESNRGLEQDKQKDGNAAGQQGRFDDAKKSDGHGENGQQDTERRDLAEDGDQILMSAQEFDALMEDQNGGTTKRPDLDFDKVRVVVVDSSNNEDGKDEDDKTIILTVQEYKKWKPLQYIKKYANPVKKSDVPPTLMPYGPHLLRPNPKTMIKDRTKNVKTREIDDNLASEKTRRMKLGDDDILEIPEVKIEVERNPKSIPNIIHFIWFSCHTYRVHHFTSMKSALEIHQPRIILLHTNCTPSGAYWDEFTKEAGPKLRIVRRSPPHDIWGQKIEKVEHQSDVARLQILLEVGGIYMDDDMVILKSLDSLRNDSIVLGEENYDALANSIVLSNRNAWFLKRWYQEYQSFNDSKWSHSSCFVPWSMWHLFPETVNVVKDKLLRPNWEEIKYIYHELWDWSNNYAVHLYSRFMQILDGTSERSLRELAILNTTYGEVSRYILWGDKEFKDITDWV